MTSESCRVNGHRNDTEERVFVTSSCDGYEYMLPDYVSFVSEVSFEADDTHTKTHTFTQHTHAYTHTHTHAHTHTHVHTHTHAHTCTQARVKEMGSEMDWLVHCLKD